jgi:hypothetical protein
MTDYRGLALDKIERWIGSIDAKDLPVPGMDYTRLVFQILQYELNSEIMAIVCKRWSQICSNDGLIWASSTPHPEIILHGTPTLWSFIFVQEPQLKLMFEIWKKHLFAEYSGNVFARDNFDDTSVTFSS